MNFHLWVSGPPPHFFDWQVAHYFWLTSGSLFLTDQWPTIFDWPVAHYFCLTSGPLLLPDKWPTTFAWPVAHYSVGYMVEYPRGMGSEGGRSYTPIHSQSGDYRKSHQFTGICKGNLQKLSEFTKLNLQEFTVFWGIYRNLRERDSRIRIYVFFRFARIYKYHPQIRKNLHGSVGSSDSQEFTSFIHQLGLCSHCKIIRNWTTISLPEFFKPKKIRKG